MIVKIFKAAKSFAGVNYNERKNENGKSELLVAENFSIAPDRLKKSDYIAYMENVCNTNKRVKGRQFHATISCKGREYSVEQLKDIAVQFVKKMGYGENPYLIYFHSDTPNNHVHIVSTRVDKQGNKVNDKMERVRAQAAINEILNVDLERKADKDIQEAKAYSFTTAGQLRVLLERQGWKVSVKGDEMKLSRCGKNISTIPLSSLEFKEPDEGRRKQIAAIMKKYKAGLSHQELQALLRSKFGIELVFHQGKGHSVPYGYTVVDNKTKSVYKGGDIMPLKELIQPVVDKDKAQHCNTVANAILNKNPKCTFEDFKAEMAEYGYKVGYDGRVSVKGSKGYLISMNSDVIKNLRYNSRVKVANSFNVINKDEAGIIGKLYNISPDDMNIGKADERRLQNVGLYEDMMKSYILNGKDVNDTLAENGFVFVKSGNEVYLIDKKEKTIVSAQELNLKLQGSEAVRYYPVDRLDSMAMGDMMNRDPDAARGFGIIDLVCGIIDQNYNVRQDGGQKRKKRKNVQQ